MKFIPRLAYHIGYGSFVSETFEFCLLNNHKILQKLHTLEFPKEKNTIS